MTRFWDVLTSDPESAPCFEVLQLLSSLESEMDYQIQRYGESSLWDDLTELESAVRRIRKSGTCSSAEDLKTTGPDPQTG
jgi:hypothetical protein